VCSIMMGYHHKALTWGPVMCYNNKRIDQYYSPSLLSSQQTGSSVGGERALD